MLPPPRSRAALVLALTTLAACGDVQPARERIGASAGAPAAAEMREPTPDHPPSITFEEVADLPYPGTVLPGAIAFSPDDAHLTYLDSPERSLVRELFALPLADAGSQAVRVVAPPGGGVTEENLSEEERLRRERERVRGLGVTSYAWSKQGERILVPSTGDIYVQDGLEGALRLVVDTEGAPALDPRFSPDGEQIAFVRDAELWVVPSAGGPPRQVTTGARGTGRTHGLAEYVAQEEMDRSRGFWWSPDGEQLAFAEVDETHLPIYRIVHQGKEAVGADAQEDHRYPFAGAANAKVRLGVVSARGGAVRWMDLSAQGDDFYLARVDWAHDGSLTAQLEDRAQRRLTLARFDPRGGEATPLLTEQSDTWINLHSMFRPLGGPDERGRRVDELVGWFLWASEETGFRHLYLHDATGARVRALTSGAWMVDELVAVDEAGRRLWFTATKDGVTERHLYEASFDGGEPRRITNEPGMHSAVIDHAHARFVDLYDSLEAPPTATLRALATGAPLRTLPKAADPRLERLELVPPQLVELVNRDGTTLHGAIYRPDPRRHGDGPYPTIVDVYGGPHAQRVVNSWGLTVDLRAQLLRERGFLVFRLDNRGSARRGLAFEGAIKNDLGDLEVQDQVDGVRWLVEQRLADPARVAIYGWSYGGYMAAMALARAPETFHVAVAGAPVTDWDGYDTHYTERYMSTPQENPAGYESSSVMTHVEKIRGELLLVHGLIDENVHFRHTARLIDALIRHQKPYQLALFPNERHSPRRLEDRVFMERQVFDFLARTLAAAPTAAPT